MMHAFVGFVLSAALVLAPKMIVKPGTQACYEIQLPNCWHTVGDNACFEHQKDADLYQSRRMPPEAMSDDYYFYQRPRAEPNILILSAVSRLYVGRHVPFTKLIPTPGAVSKERWAIRFAHPPEIRLATEAELADAVELKTNQKFSYASPLVGNRRYQPSGPLITDNGVRESVDSKYVAISSWNYGGVGLGLDELLNVFGNLFSSKSSKWWVDVFEQASGRRVIGIAGKMGGRADAVLAGLQWIEGNRFIFPLSSTFDHFEICDAEEARSGPK